MSLSRQVRAHYNREHYRRVEDVFFTVVAYLERDWVRQFLFQSTAESDLSILTSKQQVNHAFAGKLTSTCHAPPESISSFFQPNFHSNWVVIPAYNIDELSASIMVKKKRPSPGPGRGDSSEHWVTSFYRFVRNDDNGDTFCVMFDGDFVECLLFKWDSPAPA